MLAPPTEATTRRVLIDRQLARAGWDASLRDPNLLTEMMLPGYRPGRITRIEREDYQVGDELADCVLLGHAQTPIAIVEAKRTK